MKVLFISSGNSENGISPIIFNQGESLKKNNILISFFTIRGKGLIGYLKSIVSIRKKIKSEKFDIIHAHYSLSGFAAALAGAKPLIVSLMGSDVKSSFYKRFIIRIFSRLFWSSVIVKSYDMKKSICIKDALIIPNGVDCNRFHPMERQVALNFTSWDKTKRHILFAANPDRPVKNYKLAKLAYNLIDEPNIELHSLNNIKNEHMPFYFNAADVVLLTSFWEGSPNVIKESIACNRPVVSTNIGDVKYLLNDLEGCYVTSFDEREIMLKILSALNYNKIKGVDRIKELNLDSNSVAIKLTEHYMAIKKN